MIAIIKVIKLYSTMTGHSYINYMVVLLFPQNIIPIVRSIGATHCWLPAKVMYPANSTKRFSWLTLSTSILLVKNIQIYIGAKVLYREHAIAYRQPQF